MNEVPTTPYSWIGLAALLLFLAGCAVFVYALWLRRLRLLPLIAAAAGISYFVLQAAILIIFAPDRDYLVTDDPLSRVLASIPLWLVFVLLPALGLLLGLCFADLVRLERQRITPSSVKAAADSLPAGLCFYLPGGRIVLVNETMQRLCQTLTGDYLANGERFRGRLFSDTSLPVKRPVTELGLLVLELPDGAAWAISESEGRYHDAPVNMLMASDVTELLQKSEALRKLREELAGLNRQLTAYYRDVAELTVQRELLEARVKLHDEMGADLLLMRQYLTEGGAEAARRDLEQRLGRSLSFLKAERRAPLRDEYQQIFDTACQLKVSLIVEGELPREEPHKHILATALHECFTNTLRHARGDELRLRLSEDGDRLIAVLTNNGTQPTEPIREQGGLRTLRILTERIGGTMTVSVHPAFTIRLELPKEAPYVPQSPDR